MPKWCRCMYFIKNKVNPMKIKNAISNRFIRFSIFRIVPYISISLFSIKAMAVANLTVALTAPATVSNVSSYSISAKITNSGTVSSGVITLSSTLPPNLTFVSGSSTGGFACSAAVQVVTCTRSTAIAAAGTDTITLNVKTVVGAAYPIASSIIGGGDTTSFISNTVNTTVLLPDLAASAISQPYYPVASPTAANPENVVQTQGLILSTVATTPTAVYAGAKSILPVTFKNVGNTATPLPVEVVISLPTFNNAAGQLVRLTTPIKFMFKNWTFKSTYPATETTVNCSRAVAMAALESVQLQIPVTPSANSLGTLPTFKATLSANAAIWDPNPANDLLTVTAAAAVKAITLTTYNANLDPFAVVSQYSVVSNIINPASIPKWQNELPNLAHPFYRHTPDTTTFLGIDYYSLDVKQIGTQVLPAGFPGTPVLAYGDPTRPDTYSFPAHTIVSRSTQANVNAGLVGKPVKIKYSNANLASANPAYYPIVDTSIHGNNNGEPKLRTVAHLHGAKVNTTGVNNQQSDGFPEAWSSPLIPNTIPMPSTLTVPLNANPFDYNNKQESTLLWYHDHTLGMTHGNVYAGLAGAYLVQDDNEIGMMTTATTGGVAGVAKTLPHPNYQIPLIFQDRMFRNNGVFAYPDTAIGSTVFPSVVPEFFGQVMLVNGVVWPYLDVEPRKYRFRMLNGSNSRFYTFALSNGQTFQVLGSDEGFLNNPVLGKSSLTIGPGERYDVIIDFTGVALNSEIVLTNSAATVGIPITNIATRILKFRVNQPKSAVIPDSLALTATTSLRSAALGALPTLTPINAATPRQVLLFDNLDAQNRVMPSLGKISKAVPQVTYGWMDPITETIGQNTVELWEIYNNTIDSHPIHIHAGHMRVVEHQDFRGIPKTSVPNAALYLPDLVTINKLNDTVPYKFAEENGWKDTVVTSPYTVTRVIVKFDELGLFVWHCHILEHEDHDMMRPLKLQ